MPRIFDCILLDDELDLLEMRLRELEDLPVTHVIAEARTDHQGNLKPLHFQDNRYGRFSRWQGRWTHVVVEPDELPQAPPKERKDALREYLAHGLSGIHGDLILHGSVTEIPRPEVVEYLTRAPLEHPVALEMTVHAYRPGLIHPLPWRGSSACGYGALPGSGFTFLREQRHQWPMLTRAGTRLACWGEPEQEYYPDGKKLRESAASASWPRALREEAGLT